MGHAAPITGQATAKSPRRFLANTVLLKSSTLKWIQSTSLPLKSLLCNIHSYEAYLQKKKIVINAVMLTHNYNSPDAVSYTHLTLPTKIGV